MRLSHRLRQEQRRAAASGALCFSEQSDRHRYAGCVSDSRPGHCRRPNGDSDVSDRRFAGRCGGHLQRVGIEPLRSTHDQRQQRGSDRNLQSDDCGGFQRADCVTGIQIDRAGPMIRKEKPRAFLRDSLIYIVRDIHLDRFGDQQRIDDQHGAHFAAYQIERGRSVDDRVGRGKRRSCRCNHHIERR